MEANKNTLAKIFGVSLPTVTKWVDRGCPCEQRGKELMFRTPEVMLWIYGAPPSLTVRKEREEGPAERPELDPEYEKARKDKELADKTALENRVRRGELVEASEVEAGWTDIVMAARAKLLGMGAKLAAILAAETKPAAVKAEIDALARQVLMELAADGDG